MLEAIGHGLSGLGAGVTNLHWSNPIMIAIACLLLYLAMKKDVFIMSISRPACLHCSSAAGMSRSSLKP